MAGTTDKRWFLWLRRLLVPVAIALLIAILWRADQGQLYETLKGLAAVGIAASFLFIVANCLSASLRFGALAAPDMKFLPVLETVMAAHLLNYASMVQGLGMGAKMGLMRARDVAVSRSAASIGCEIALDVVVSVLVCLAWFTLVSPPDFNGGLNQLYLVFPVILVLVVVFIGLRRVSMGRELLAAFADIARDGRWFPVLAGTIGVWFGASAGLYALLVIGSGAYLSPALALVAVCGGFLAGLISLVPGGLGVREATFAVILSGAGMSLEAVALLAVVYRLMTLVTVVVLLIVSQWLQRVASPASVD